MTRLTLLCRVGLPLLLLSVSGSAQNVPPPAAKPGQTDWQVVIGDLQERYAAAARTTRAEPAVRDSNLPLAALEIEKLQQRLSLRYRRGGWSREQEASEAAANAALQRLADGQVALAEQTGAEQPEGYFERAYLSRPDNSPQPYFVRLPTDYDPTKRYPLLLFLHGYVPETSKLDPWVLPAKQWQMAADRGLILCLPHGRRNTDFLGIGEVDVLRVYEEMCRWYSIDLDRVFMTGCSMGGYGGWAIGLRHPDLFAGLGLMSGQTDFFTWERRNRDADRFKAWCILQNNPLDLAVNAQHLPVSLQHGGDDPLVPVVHSRLIVPVLQQLGYDIDYTEYKGQGHYIYWEDEPFEKLFDWCLKPRRVKAPPQVSYKTYTTRCGRAYWTDIRRFQQWGSPGEVKAAFEGDRLTLTTSNVAELWLSPPDSLVPESGATVVLNGQEAGRLQRGTHRLRIGPDGQVRDLVAATPPVEPPVTGPAREVFNQPFIVCYTTGDNEAINQHNEARAKRFRAVWFAFSEGLLPLPVPCSTLTADQVKEHNLVIFGEPGSATLAGIADAAAALPHGITIEPGKYTFGRHSYQGDELGCYLLQHHPVNPRGLILWCSGAEYGQGLPVNHQFDLLPDVLVYNQQQAPDSANQYLLGGFLTQDGALDDSLLDVAAKGD